MENKLIIVRFVKPRKYADDRARPPATMVDMVDSSY